MRKIYRVTQTAGLPGHRKEVVQILETLSDVTAIVAEMSDRVTSIKIETVYVSNLEKARREFA